MTRKVVWLDISWLNNLIISELVLIADLKERFEQS